MENSLSLSPFFCILIRYLITAWCLIFLVICTIITKQSKQGKKLQEVRLRIQEATHLVTHNGLAGKLISQTKQSVIIELASGEKKEIPFHLVDYVYSKK